MLSHRSKSLARSHYRAIMCKFSEMSEKHLGSPSFCAVVCFFFKYIVHPTYPNDMKLPDTQSINHLWGNSVWKRMFLVQTWAIQKFGSRLHFPGIPKKKLASSLNQLLICPSVKYSCCGHELLSLSTNLTSQTLFASWSIEDSPTNYNMNSGEKGAKSYEHLHPNSKIYFVVSAHLKNTMLVQNRSFPQ